MPTERLMLSSKATPISILVGLILIGTSGCLYSPFLRSDGPSQTQGVAVSLARQRCSFEPPWTRPDQSRGNLDLWMRLKIKNGTPQVVTVDPQQMRLLVGNVAGDRPAIVGQIHYLAPSETNNVDVRFQQQADFGCTGQMSLSLKQGIQVGPQHIELRPVAFVANAQVGDTSDDTPPPPQGFVVTTD